MKWIKDKNNLNGMSNNIFYCGCWALNEKRTKLVIFLGLFKSLIGLNKACYIHDKHYNYLFEAKYKLFKFLWFKFLVDTLFLWNCWKYAAANDESKIKLPHRLILSIIFYIIVICATPVYMWVYRK